MRGLIEISTSYKICTVCMQMESFFCCYCLFWDWAWLHLTPTGFFPCLSDQYWILQIMVPNHQGDENILDWAVIPGAVERQIHCVGMVNMMEVFYFFAGIMFVMESRSDSGHISCCFTGVGKEKAVKQRRKPPPPKW